MTSAESAPAARSAPDAKAPPTAFGQGFVLDTWYFVALSRDVAPGSLKRHELLGEPVLIGRTKGGQVFAMRDICPHRAAPLSAGRLVEHRSAPAGAPKMYRQAGIQGRGQQMH